MFDSVPAPMVHLPADKLEALRTTHTRWEVSDSDDAQATLNLVAAARAALTAALPHIGDGRGHDHTDLLGVSVTQAITEAETTNDVCACSHVQGWHHAEGGGVFGMCLWPNGWPNQRECKCDAFTPRLSPTGDDSE